MAEFEKPASYVGNTLFMMLKILFDSDTKSNKKTYYLADYPWYSTKKWANNIQRTLNSKNIRTSPYWLLKLGALFGDLIKLIIKKDLPLTSFRLKNMLTGGSYPLKNIKELCPVLPYNLKKSVYITAKWMYDRNMLDHKPKEL